MRKFLTVLALVLLMASPALGQARFDSVSMEPSYVEPGDDVEVVVKFHEGLTTRELYATPTRDEEPLPLYENKDTSYVATLTPKNAAAAEHLLVKQDQRRVGHLFTGESWSVPFDVHVSDDTPPTNYTLEFRLLKTDLEGTGETTVALSKDIQVKVNGVPKFTLDSDSQLTAGETQDFTVRVGNVGGATARQVTLTLNSTFPLTVLRSSTAYIGDMPGDAHQELVYDLNVDSSADPKSYTMPVDIKYVDRAGATQTVTKNLGVKVEGMPVISASLDSFDDFMAGVEGTVTVSVINKGFVDANFLSVELVETGDYTVTSNSEVYIGNLASDDFETEDFTIKVADGVSGKIPLKVKVSYTEENRNQVHEEDHNLDLNVLAEDEYLMKHPRANGIQSLIGMVAVIPLLIIAYLVLWLLWKLVGLITGFIDRKVFKRS